MAHSASETDMSIGVGLLFTVVGLVAAAGLGMAGTLAATGEDHAGEGLQLLSGLGLAAALLAGSVAIVALHVYYD